MKKFNCYCTIIMKNGSKTNNSRDVLVIVQASGRSEAKVAARTLLKKQHKNLFSIAVRKVESCLS